MPMIPFELKQQLSSPDPRVREEAAKELRDDPDLESLRLLKHLLSDEEHEVVYAAGRSLAAIGSREAVEELISLLYSEDARLRNLAIELISRIGAVALPLVARLLDDRDKDIRKFAVDTLGMVNSPETEVFLIQALFDENINVAAAAAEALGSAGTQRAVPCLIECLGKHPWLTCAALKSLGAIGGEEALTAILSTGPQEEGIILFCAVTALGAIGDSRGLDFLLALLTREDPVLESSVMQALESILKQADAETLQRVKNTLPTRQLIGFLDHENRDIVRNAIGLLGLLQEETAVEALARLYSKAHEQLFDVLEEALQRIHPERLDPIVKILENEREPESVKIAAIRLVGRIGQQGACQPLMASFETCSNTLKAEIIMALAALRETRALPLLHTLLTDETTSMQALVIEALERFRDPSSIPHLIAVSADPAASLRSKAAKSLRKYTLTEQKASIVTLLQAPDPNMLLFGLDMIPADLVPEFEKDILALCRNEDEAVRKIAVERASFLKNDPAYDVLVNSLSDRDSQVQLAAIRGLEQYPERDIGKRLLQAAVSDSDAWNRYEAVQILGRLRLVQTLPELVSLLETAPELVKAAILDVLGELGGSGHHTIIRRYMQADNDLLREAAIEAMEKCSR